MSVEIILTILSVLTGGLAVAIFNHFMGIKKEREERQRRNKENQYKKFLENLIAFFEGWNDKDRKKNFMEELYTHAPLYASTNVIRLANDFLNSLKIKDVVDLSIGGKSDVYYKKLVVAIREDIGMWNKDKLVEKDIEILKLD